MCLAVPAEVIALAGKTATISAEGALRQVDVSLVEDLAVGDYVLVHAGFALTRWTRDDFLAWQEIMSPLASGAAGDAIRGDKTAGDTTADSAVEPGREMDRS